MRCALTLGFAVLLATACGARTGIRDGYSVAGEVGDTGDPYLACG